MVSGVFDLGLMKIKGEKYFIEEITVTSTRENTERYTSDSYQPVEIRKGRLRIEFTIKRAWDDGRLSKVYEDGTEFQIMLYNNDVSPPEAVVRLDGCVLGKDQLGTFSGDKHVQQDLEGKAIARVVIRNN
jgi:hypothetical protein